MAFSKVLSLSLIIALSSATPVVNSPSRVVRRDDPPKPSTYPLGDPCGHEWQYLNFKPDDAADKSRLEKLHGTICGGELRAIASYGQVSAERTLKPYNRYFPPKEGDDEDEDYPKRVGSILKAIAGESSEDGGIGAIVADMVVDNKDFAGNGENPDQGTCADEGTLGYTLVDGLDNREKIHFCDPAWDRKGAGDVDCKSLDPFPSTKMDAFSRIVLHEMTHYKSVGAIIEEQIIDAKNKDGNYAYDPPRTHGLLDPEQDDQPALTEINADSYGWMGLDAWISRNCAEDATNDNWQDFFKEDPPKY